MVREAGYFAQTTSLDVPPPGGSPVKSRISLSIDRSHPRWPRPEASGKFSVGAFAGYAWTSSLKAAANDGCSGQPGPGVDKATCSGNDRARGFLAGLRGSYRFPFGLAIEVGAGYLSLSSSFSRILDVARAADPLRYYIDDQLSLRGPFATVGAGYRLGIGKRFSATGRLAGGMLFARSQDALTAQARTLDSAPVEVPIADRGSPASSIAVLVAPEIGGAVVFGSFEVGLGLGALIVINQGPSLENGRLQPNEALCDRVNDSGSVHCSSTSAIVNSERAYGSGLFALTPQITATYTF